MSVYLVSRGEGGAPVYRQIRDVLVNEIRCLYKANDALPTEAELAQRFRVNRHTLRRAIDEMVAEGFVERRHGKGVFVLEPAINYTIGRTTRFTATLQSQGRTTSSTVIRKQLIPARGGVASRLQLREGDEVIFIETLRKVESRPFCVISHFLPFSKFAEVLHRYDDGSLYEFLDRHYAIELKREESFISAVLPEADDASLLSMPRHVPVLRVKSLNLDVETSQPVEYAVTRFRGDAAQLFVQP